MNSVDAFRKFVDSAQESTRHCTLRGQLDFVTDEAGAVDIAQVEGAASIVKRFCTGMGFKNTFLKHKTF